MLRRIITYISVGLLTAAAGCYFYFASKIEKDNIGKLVCRKITVKILDSTENRFVNARDVKELLYEFVGKCKGMPQNGINLFYIEKLLDKRSAIKNAQASLTREGTLRIEIMQRRPVLRIETGNGGFYVDETGFVFPLMDNYSSYVPVVSGKIPFAIDDRHLGRSGDKEEKWLKGILDLGEKIRGDSFLDAQIEQIYIDCNGDIKLYPRVGRQTIVIGGISDMNDKFDRLKAFYRNIIPYAGWEKYSSVNLKYKGQIVCKKKKQE
ncbi:MAG: hypothetical protein LKI53_04295 [Bacteroidales bacterium]|jgi:cell division protein FtsQ|nr:hypothetical protein [Bacteroidales bacterium]